MQKRRVLIVEDEMITAEDLRMQLKRTENHTTHQVSTGEEAIALLQKQPVDLVIMDVQLQGELDGIETARRIRNKFDTPVLFVTAYSDRETSNRINKTDPQGILFKPIKTEILLQKIRTILQQTGKKHDDGPIDK